MTSIGKRYACGSPQLLPTLGCGRDEAQERDRRDLGCHHSLQLALTAQENGTPNKNNGLRRLCASRLGAAPLLESGDGSPRVEPARREVARLHQAELLEGFHVGSEGTQVREAGIGPFERRHSVPAIDRLRGQMTLAYIAQLLVDITVESNSRQGPRLHVVGGPLSCRSVVRADDAGVTSEKLGLRWRATYGQKRPCASRRPVSCSNMRCSVSTPELQQSAPPKPEPPSGTGDDGSKGAWHPPEVLDAWHDASRQLFEFPRAGGRLPKRRPWRLTHNAGGGLRAARQQAPAPLAVRLECFLPRRQTRTSNVKISVLRQRWRSATCASRDC